MVLLDDGTARRVIFSLRFSEMWMFNKCARRLRDASIIVLLHLRIAGLLCKLLLLHAWILRC